jgi:hypothetical protein
MAALFPRPPSLDPIETASGRSVAGVQAGGRGARPCGNRHDRLAGRFRRSDTGLQAFKLAAMCFRRAGAGAVEHLN